MIPERIRWAVEVVDPGPSDHLLEVGCGPGIAASLICERLTTGSMLAVDRSPTAVARTFRRNADHIASGRLTVCAGSLDRLDVGARRFDAAFTVDVNVFWTQPRGPDVGALAGVLRPGGRLLILYGADGPTAATRVTEPIEIAMTAAGLDDVRVLSGAGGIGVTGRRPV